MEVLKFGGASVKDVAAIKNVGNIIANYEAKELVLIISAMGKVTNQLEEIYHAYLKQTHFLSLWNTLKQEHYIIAKQLCNDVYEIKLLTALNELFEEAEEFMEDEPVNNLNFIYDQIVSMGEMLSTTIVSHYLAQIGIDNDWVNVKNCIKTDNNYREANVDWNKTQDCIQETFNKNQKPIKITQGFLGATPENFTTTLGREGSDYSAAIFAHCLKADKMTVWKDVPGILNGDPRYIDNTVKIERLTYRQANEMTHFGAKVIHPKTMQPLAEENIVLEVRSFINPENHGTLISGLPVDENLIPPVVVLNSKQILLKVSHLEEELFLENDIALIYQALAKHQVLPNISNQTAYDLRLGLDNKPFKNDPLFEEILKSYKIEILNEELLQFTFLHWNTDFVQKQLNDQIPIIEQKSKEVYKVLVDE